MHSFGRPVLPAKPIFIPPLRCSQRKQTAVRIALFSRLTFSCGLRVSTYTYRVPGTRMKIKKKKKRNYNCEIEKILDNNSRTTVQAWWCVVIRPRLLRGASGIGCITRFPEWSTSHYRLESNEFATSKVCHKGDRWSVVTGCSLRCCSRTRTGQSSPGRVLRCFLLNS